MPLKSVFASLRYAGAFAILASIPSLYSMNPFAPLATVAIILFAIVLGEQSSPKSTEQSYVENVLAAALLPILYIPAQMAVVAWGLVILAHNDTNAREVLALAVPTGLTMGIFGVLAAHEMVHSRNVSKQRWGGLLLAGMCYRHFRIAHVYGHHRFAGTEDDPSVVQRGENFYAFFLRTVVAQVAFAWCFEQRRCRNRQLSWVHNHCLHDLCIAALLCTTVFLTFGKGAVVFFLLQSFIAILVLELFNYIAHYGLIRRRDHTGVLEPFAAHHAWNMSAPLANLIVLNMGRHSDHHRRPSASYETLRPVAQSPELPAGYAGSILMALFPPLWRHIMDRRLVALSTLQTAPQAA
jgi:alkane 1-monooxygenase